MDRIKLNLAFLKPQMLRSMFSKVEYKKKYLRYLNTRIYLHLALQVYASIQISLSLYLSVSCPYSNYSYYSNYLSLCEYLTRICTCIGSYLCFTQTHSLSFSLTHTHTHTQLLIPNSTCFIGERKIN